MGNRGSVTSDCQPGGRLTSSTGGRKENSARKIGNKKNKQPGLRLSGPFGLLFTVAPTLSFTDAPELLGCSTARLFGDTKRAEPVFRRRRGFC